MWRWHTSSSAIKHYGWHLVVLLFSEQTLNDAHSSPGSSTARDATVNDLWRPMLRIPPGKWGDQINFQMAMSPKMGWEIILGGLCFYLSSFVFILMHIIKNITSTEAPALTAIIPVEGE